MSRCRLLIVLLILLIPAEKVFLAPEPDTPINIVDVTWGVSPDRLGVGPGDRAVPLSVTMQNLGSDIISGINMYLELEPPFTNLTDGNAASSYVSLSLQPGQSASAQFMLNVAESASTGEYIIPLTIVYFVVEQSTTSESSTTQDTSTSSSSKSKTKMKSSSTSQTQTSKSKSTQTTTSSTVFSVQKTTVTTKIPVWLSGKTMLDIDSPAEVLTGGQANTFPIVIRNTGSSGASALTVTVSLQSSAVSSPTSSSPLVVQEADTQWYIQYLPAGSNTTLNPRIFASTDAIDKAYQVQVSLSYRDSVGTVHNEVRSLGLTVQGSIKIVLQSFFIAPAPVGSGGNITVSGELLNEGNVAAKYVNATAVISPPFEALDGSSIYLGELDPDTPIPFSISLRILNGTANGTYPLDMVFYYKDSFGDTHSLKRTLDVTVLGVARPPKPPERRDYIVLRPIVFYSLIGVTIAAIAGCVYLLLRRRIRQ